MQLSHSFHPMHVAPRRTTRDTAPRARSGADPAARLARCPPAVLRAAVACIFALAAVGCSATDAATGTVATTPLNPVAPAVPAAPAVLSANTHQLVIVGVAFAYDASKAGSAFSDPVGGGLTYTVTLTPAGGGLAASGAIISGAPARATAVRATITATAANGAATSNTFYIVAVASGLASPTLPSAPASYSDASAPLPALYVVAPPGAGPPAVGADNTPADNAITNAGATLGRVLFHDKRVSVNDAVACASCHLQAAGFADTARLSRGFAGGFTGRHSMALANARFYARGRFFWDERAATLEAQVVTPIQDAVEMGMTLDALEAKLALLPYYPSLFQAAFGTPAVTRDRIAKALAQFVRSMTSRNAKFDRAFNGAGVPDFAATFTAEELLGAQLFGIAPPAPGVPNAGCVRCHGSNALISDNIHNTGLDATTIDAGAGNAQFKAPSLRNVGVRGRYMHDGRFVSLAEVVEFYDANVNAHPNLDNRLRAGPGGPPLRLGLSAAQKSALVTFLHTLTDSVMLGDARFSSPFPP